MGTSRSSEPEGDWTGGAFIYSGRRDPTWKVPEDIVKRLMAMWEAAEAVRGGLPKPPILGYRGCFLRRGDYELVAYRSVISLNQKGKTEARRDEGRAFERTLLGSAPRGTIPPEVLKGEPGLA